MTTIINVHGPINITVAQPEGDNMSALTDAVNALVAEDGVVKTALDDLAAKVAAGTATQADAQAATDAVNGEVAKLQAAVAADDASAAPAPAPVNQPPADQPPAA